MRVALYARVSTVRQAEKDLSIPDQLRQLKAYCEQHDHEIVAEYRENGASATDDNRPQFQAMVEAIQFGSLQVDAILVLTTSRFFRNAVDGGIWRRTLKKAGVDVIAITQETGTPNTPTSNLLGTIFAAIDEHESQMIGFHTARGMKENARKGFFNGSRPPYGYKVERTTDDRGNPKSILVPDEEEAKQVRRIFEIYTKENQGAVEIAKMLNRDSMFRRINKKTGKPTKWNSVEVLRVLENTAYIGQYVFSRFDAKNKIVRPESEWVVVSVPAIVDENTFNAAHIIRKGKMKEWKNGRAYDGPLLLIGMLKCGKCGASMVSSTGKGGKYVYYTCRTYLKEGKTACPGHRVQVRSFEKHVLEQILNWAFSEANVKAVVAEVRKALAERHRPVKELRSQIADVERKLTRYYDAFEDGTLDPANMDDRVKELKVKEKKLEDELEHRTSVKELPPHLSSPENIALIRDELLKLVFTGSPQTVKRYLGILVEDIVMDGKKVSIRVKNEGILALLEQKEKLSTGGVAPVLNSVYKWRPQRDSNSCRRRERAVS